MRTQACDGFSLLELMVVVVVFGVLVALAFPTMSGYMRSTRLSGATNTLTADLHQAHSLATMQRRTVEMRFDSTGYRIVVPSVDSTVLARQLPTGLWCSASDTARFYPWGLTEAISMTVVAGGSSKVLQLSSNGKVTHD